MPTGAESSELSRVVGNRSSLTPNVPNSNSSLIFAANDLREFNLYAA